MASLRSNNPIVFFDITIGGEMAGRLTMELRRDVAPKTAENFKALCTGEAGVNEQGQKRSFKGTPFHRCQRDLVCQSGDWVHKDGTGSESVFEGEPLFEDENFILRHTGPGCLSMANRGPDTNGSQFYITFVETTWLNDHHVVFGVCMGEESFDVLDRIHQVSSPLGKTTAPVVIANCGQLFVDTEANDDE